MVETCFVKLVAVGLNILKDPNRCWTVKQRCKKLHIFDSLRNSVQMVHIHWNRLNPINQDIGTYYSILNSTAGARDR